MSTISSTGVVIPSPIPVPTTTTPPTTPASSSAPSQLFSSRFTGASTAIALGLASPSTSLGDFEALFAEIAEKLKTTQTESRSDSAVAQSEDRRSKIQRALTLLSEFERQVGVIKENQENIKVQNANIAAIDSELVGLNAQKTSLNTQIADIDAQIADANGATPGLDAQRANLVSQLGGVQGQIDALEADRQEAVDSKNESQANINNAIFKMISLLFAWFTFMVTALTLVQGEEMRAAGQTHTSKDDFEQSFLDVWEHVNKLEGNDIDFRFFEEAAITGAGALSEQQGDGVPERFGAVPSAQASALGFAAAVETLAGVLSGLGGSDVTQSAGAMAQEGLARTRVPL